MFCSKPLFGVQSKAGSLLILLVCGVLFFLSGSALAQKMSGKI